LLTTQTSFLERYRTLLLLLTATWTAMGVVIYVWVPLLVPALLLLSPVAPVGWYAATRLRPPPHKPSAITLALILAGAYLTLNASWSLSPAMAHVTLAFFFLFVLALYFTCNTLPDNDADVQRAMAIGLCVGLAIGSVVMLFEIASLQWIHRTLMSLVPALRPKPRDMILENGWIVFIQSYLINRNITAMTFLFWPAVLAIFLVAPAVRRHLWLGGLVPVAAAVLGSKHATSKIAFVGAAMAFAAFQVWPAATRRLIAWAWAGAILLVVPLATLAFHSQLYLSDWIPRSAQHRIVIWGYTSKQIANAPILGSGINTARALNDPDGYDVPVAPGSDFKLTTSLHSHNVYLQAWYETGAVGALLLLAIGLLVLRALAGAPREIQSYLYATFVTCALLGGTSFSLWQPWFMASFGLAAGFAALGWALAERTDVQSEIVADGNPPASTRDCEAHTQLKK
jgi:O-antigen ligase